MAKRNVWLSVSDLMTGLMIIFLFIAVSYISKNQDNESVLREYVDAKTKMHDRLEKDLSQYIKENKVEILPDLTMRFKSTDALFDGGEYELKDEFKQAIDEVMPIYLNALLRDSLRKNIKEIRIEGHTSLSGRKRDVDPFIYNAELSQKRALEVLKYIKANIAQNYEGEDKRYLEFWLTANGFSSCKALDSDGNYVFESGKGIDPAKSRRVEIRLITKGDEILESFVKKTLE